MWPITAALERGEWSAAGPGRTLPPGKTRYPLYRRVGGSQGRSEWAENLVPTGIWSPTVQPIVSRYTDCATRPIYIYIYVTSIVLLKNTFADKTIWNLRGKHLPWPNYNLSPEDNTHTRAHFAAFHWSLPCQTVNVRYLRAHTWIFDLKRGHTVYGSETLRKTHTEKYCLLKCDAV